MVSPASFPVVSINITLSLFSGCCTARVTSADSTHPVLLSISALCASLPAGTATRLPRELTSKNRGVGIPGRPKGRPKAERRVDLRALGNTSGADPAGQPASERQRAMNAVNHTGGNGALRSGTSVTSTLWVSIWHTYSAPAPEHTDLGAGLSI